MRRWCEQDNLFWSEEVRALLFLSSKDANTVEAHMIDDNADVLNLLFHLGLIRGFEVNWSSHCSFTLVNKTAKAGDFSDLKCFQISVISN
jgi:hypothetical protein